MMRSLTAVAVVVSLCVPALGQQPLRADDIPISAAATKQARAFHNLKVSKRLVQRRVKKLIKELNWHKSLPNALAAAEKSGKPIVWIHALGSLTGFV